MGKRIEWMCTRCGRKVIRPESMGRPQPGMCLKSFDKKQPHCWVKNREF